MNKRAATKYIDENKVTLGELRGMIKTARGRGGMSSVNKQFTLEQTLDIFDATMKDDERGDDIVVVPWVYSGRLQRDIRSKSFLCAVNIIRDCM